MACNTASIDPWVLARGRYMEDLDEDEKKAFKTASIENLFYSASAAQKDHKEKSRSRALSSKLEPLVSAIDQYGRALDVYSNTYSLAMSPLWGSIRVLLQVAQAFEKYFEKLIEMFARIGDILPRCQVYQSLFPSHQRLLQAISVTYLDIIYFCMDAKKTFRKLKKSTTIHLTLKLLWKDFSRDFERTLNTLRGHVKTVEKEAGVSNMIEASDDRALARADREERERKRKVEERDLLLSQLSSIRYADKHVRERKRRHPGSGTWLTETAEFEALVTGHQSSCLWCYGIPGSGKTVLASTLIDTLSIGVTKKDVTIQTLTSEDIIRKNITRQEVAITYYYCDFSDPKSLEARGVLGTLLRQLLNEIMISEDLKKQLDQFYRPDIRIASTDEVVAILFAVIEQFSKVYIFIDGLDECGKEDRNTISSTVKQLAGSDSSIVKIVVTSQETAEISKFLGGFPYIQISEENNSSDIVSFIEETVTAHMRSGVLAVNDFSLKTDIMSALIDGAQGMFLWVNFQIADLCDCVSEFEIRETLQNLPKGMAATYARILQKISSVRTNMILARRIFKWIICAKRPLLITELTEAIAFGPSDRWWDARKIPDATRSIQACGNLVVFDEENKTVRLAHHSVRQFLLESPAQESISEFHFELAKADLEAGELCVAYLSFSDFETQLTIPIRSAKDMPSPGGILDSVKSTSSPGHITSGIFKLRQHLRQGSTRQQTPVVDLEKFIKLRKPPPPSLREKYLFLDYAIENWTFHTLEFTEENTKMWKSFKYLAMEKPMAFDFRVWGENHLTDCLPYTSLFRWAVDTGHVPLLKLLPQSHGDYGLQSYFRQDHEEGRSVMLNAFRYGHEHMVELLVKEQYVDDHDGKILLKAAENGYDFTVQLLLTYGHVSKWTKTEALRIAAEHGQTAVMQAVLEYETPSDLQVRCVSLVMDAAIGGHYEMVQLLLEKSADIEGGRGAFGNTALLELSDIGHKTAVKMLLEKGADINTKSSWGNTALHLASRKSYEAVVQLLLEEGADINAMNESRETALQFAAREGHETVVKMLLKKGANINAKSKLWNTALHQASRNGYEAVVQLLLEEGADINAMNDFGEKALHLAARGGHETVVKMLLEKGADVNPKGNWGKTALYIAAGNGKETIVQLLLGEGADINAKVSGGGTALYIAVSMHHESVVRLLLDQGANVNATGIWSSFTPLHTAAEKGHEAMVRLLLEAGADVNAKNGSGLTAVQVADGKGHKGTAKLLRSSAQKQN